MSAAVIPRSGADVAADLSQRRERQAALTEQLAPVAPELEAMRKARARSVAEGREGPSAAEIATLLEEKTSLESAIALLADDITALEREAVAVAIHEAATAESQAIDEAMSAIEELDSVLRDSAKRLVLPAAARFESALRDARRAQNDHDRLARRENPSMADPRDRAEKVLNRRTAMLGVVAALRAHAQSAQAAPNAGESSAVAFEGTEATQGAVPEIAPV